MKKISAMILIMAIIFCLSSCGDDKEFKALTYEMDSVISNIDPLIAKTQSEIQVVNGMFEFLMRVGTDGSIVPGAAESYTVDSSNKIYTFTLREGLLWSDGVVLTANDFKFGIIRCLTKKTASNWATGLFDIKNAKNYYNGKTSASSVGIKTVDDRTLIITAESPVNEILAATALPGASPCREDFFNSTEGHYGLGPDYIISNGPFSLGTWYDEVGEPEYVTLNKNKQYNGSCKAAVDRVTINFSSQTDRSLRLADDKIQVAVAGSDLIDNAERNGNKLLTYQKSTLALCINPQDDLMKSSDLRNALLHSVPRDNYKQYLPAHLTVTDDFIPTTAVTGKSLYRTSEENISPSYDVSVAKSSFNKFLSDRDDDSHITVKVLYDGDADTKTLLSYVVQEWQKDFGLYAEIEEKTAEELDLAIQNGSYQIAVKSFEPTDSTAQTMLEQFTFDDTAFKGYSTEKFIKYLKNAKKAADTKSTIAELEKAEKELLSTGYLISLAHGMDGYVYSASSGNVRLYPRGGIIELTTLGS